LSSSPRPRPRSAGGPQFDICPWAPGSRHYCDGARSSARCPDKGDVASLTRGSRVGFTEKSPDPGRGRAPPGRGLPLSYPVPPPLRAPLARVGGGGWPLFGACLEPVTAPSGRPLGRYGFPGRGSGPDIPLIRHPFGAFPGSGISPENSEYSRGLGP